MKTPKSVFNKNKLKNFIIYAHSFAQMMIPYYSSKFSKHTFTNAAKFTILAIKTYSNFTYRKVCDWIDLNSDI